MINGKTEIDEWNNPLADIATAYWRNGSLEDYDGCFQVTLTPTELMAVVGYMMLGMNKVDQINSMGGAVDDSI